MNKYILLIALSFFSTTALPLVKPNWGLDYKGRVPGNFTTAFLLSYGIYADENNDGDVLKFSKMGTDGVWLEEWWGGVYIPYLSEEGEIRVRRADNRIYVDKEQYIALLTDECYWHWIGDKDYIPYEENDNGELLLYDFNMQVGDRYPHVDGHEDIIVTDVESVVLEDGKSRRLMTLSNGYKVLEGVGCINSPGEWLFYLNPNSSGIYPYPMVSLNYYLDHGVGMNVEYLSISEQETRIQELNADRKQSCATQYIDLQGRRVTTPSQPGVYVRNGKLVIIK